VDYDLAVLSPEKTIVTYRLAGLGSRIGAHLLDILLVIALIFGIVLLGGVVALSVPAVGVAMITLGYSATPFLYFILLEGLWNGCTVGKKACGLRVRMADGTPVTFAAALGRNLLRPADLLPGTYFVGLLAIFTTQRSQRIGDLVCNTVVVHERRSIPYFVPAPHVAGFHPLENRVGNLHGMTAEEYVSLRKYCDRFPELHPTIQDKLTREIFLPIAAKRGIPLPPNIHPIYLAEAAVMKYGRDHGML
jgi:uncharacterized RDD family membrane protein YckC